MGLRYSLVPHESVPLSSIKGTNDLEWKYSSEVVSTDEMNIHMVQTEEAYSEVVNIMNVMNCIMDPQSNSNIMGLVMDALTGVYLLTQEGVVIDDDTWQDCLMLITAMEDLPTLDHRLQKNKMQKLTGKALFSALLPNDFYYNKNGVFIRDGILISGAINKKSGGVSQSTIIQEIWKNYGRDRTVEFLTDSPIVISRWLMDRGFSVGLRDCFPLNEKHKKIINEEMTKVRVLAQSYGVKLKDPLEEERREKELIGVLNRGKDLGANITKNALPADNNLKIMTESGAKGSDHNVAQITAGLGQQFMMGQRMPLTISEGKRCLPIFEEGSLDPEARGFCTSSFVEGLSPSELFFHQAGGREGLIDTAIKTAEIGDLHHRMVKLLENIIIKGDGSVRDENNSIIQPIYGEDGFDAKELQFVDILGLKIAFFIDLDHVSKQINTKYDELPDYNPQPLTSDQITDIVITIPYSKCSNNVTSETIRADLNKTISLYLTTIKIDFRGLPNLKEKIINSYNKSLAQTGDVVGITAASSVGRPTMQMALNSFHVSGSSKNVTYGVAAIKEVINATEEIKRPTMTIIFNKEDITFDEIYDEKRNDIVKVTVSDLVEDYEAETKEILFQEDIPWWYQYYGSLITSNIPYSKYILRLHIDVNAMFAHKLQPKNICDAINNSSDNVVFCVPSPIYEEAEENDFLDDNNKIVKIKIPMPKLIIDLHVNENNIKDDNLSKIGIEDISLLYIETTILPGLDSLYIKGIPSITALFPVTTPIWKVVRTETRISDHKWKIWYDQTKMKVSGIIPERIKRLVQTAGMSILEYNDEEIKAGNNNLYLKVEIPKSITSADSPGKIILSLLAQDREKKKKYEQERKDVRNEMLKKNPVEARKIKIERPPTAILQASESFYADTNGSSLNTILGRDDVDTAHTFSNSMYEIFKNFGIEAVRNFLIKILNEVISYDGQYINIRHVILLADFMTYRGNITKITYSGLKKQESGPLSRASFQRALDVLTEAAVFGSEEKVESTSTSLFIGKKPLIGTGVFNMEVDQKKKLKLEQQALQANTGEIKKLDLNQFEQSIKDSGLVFDFPEFVIKEKSDDRSELLMGTPQKSIDVEITNQPPAPSPATGAGIVGGEKRKESVFDLLRSRPNKNKLLENIASKNRDLKIPCQPSVNFNTFSITSSSKNISSTPLSSKLKIPPSPGSIIPPSTAITKIMIPSPKTGIYNLPDISNLIEQGKKNNL